LSQDPASGNSHEYQIPVVIFYQYDSLIEAVPREPDTPKIEIEFNAAELGFVGICSCGNIQPQQLEEYQQILHFD
jgi:hypothetical protein